MVRRVGQAAEYLAGEMTNALSKTGEPSVPGEYPKKQTGELAASVRVRRKGLEALIGPTADHAKWLAKSGRKMAPELLADKKNAVARILLKG